MIETPVFGSLDLDAIRIDGGTQSRVELNEDVVAEYAEAMIDGATFPPVVVFFDGSNHWLADGFHRFFGAKKADFQDISVEIRPGAKRDAVLFSVGANGSHGLRRSNADKRRAVETLLKDAEWTAWSDNAIAKACGVTHKTVSAHRKSILGISQDTERGGSILGISQDTPPATRTVQRNGVVYEQNTSNIGKPKEQVAQKQQFAEQSPIDDDLDAIAIVREENDRLNDRLAVVAMDATPEERSAASETIDMLRATVRTLTAELDAVKASRDSYMTECSEMKKQCLSYKRQLDKLKKAD